jgi:hypothetical protein
MAELNVNAKAISRAARGPFGAFSAHLVTPTSLSSLGPSLLPFAFFCCLPHFLCFLGHLICSSDGRYGGVDLAAFVRNFRRRYRRPLGPISHLIFTAYQRNTYEGSVEHVVQVRFRNAFTAATSSRRLI